MSSDTSGSLHAVVNPCESFQSRRTGTMTDRGHCVQIPHDHSLDGPSWNFLYHVPLLWWNSEFRQSEWVCLHWMTDGYYLSFFFFLRVKMAEECFKQAREKASYNVKPKHATGIVCILTLFTTVTVSYRLFFLFAKTLFLKNTCQGCWRNTPASGGECQRCQL